MSNEIKTSLIIMRSVGTQTPRLNSMDTLCDNSLKLVNNRNESNNDTTLENSKVIINSFSQPQLNKSEMNIEFQIQEKMTKEMNSNSNRMKYKKLKMNPIVYNRFKEDIKVNNVNFSDNKLKTIKENKSITNIYTNSQNDKSPQNKINKFKYQKSKKFDYNQSIVQQILSLQNKILNNNNNNYHRNSSLNNMNNSSNNNNSSRRNINHSLSELSLKNKFQKRNTKPNNAQNNKSLLLEFPLLEIKNNVKPTNDLRTKRLKLLRKSNRHLYKLSFFKPPKYPEDKSKHFIYNHKTPLFVHNKVKISLSLSTLNTKN